jgi:lysophospholipid acyltransferase 5
VVVSFVFNFGYLLVGYWYTASENYDICWTMPHCVLSLRLIGKLNNFFDSFMPLFSSVADP